jgi:hypothetical protein
MGQSRSMSRRRLAGLSALVLLVNACASVPCRPVQVVVDRKEERSRLRSEVRGLRTDPTGRVVEERRDVIVPEFWVRGADGRWYDVGEAEWRAAEPGSTLTVCR